MFIDEKGKLFGKVNLLDLLVVLIIIAALAFGGYYFIGKDSGTGSKMPIEYTVEVVKKDAKFFEHIIPGETVVDGKTKQPMGEIVSFEKHDCKIITQDNRDLSLKLDAVEGKFDGTIKIKLDADVAYPDFKSGNETIKIGKSVAYRSESAAIHGYIIGIDYDEAALKEMR